MAGAGAPSTQRRRAAPHTQRHEENRRTQQRNNKHSNPAPNTTAQRRTTSNQKTPSIDTNKEGAQKQPTKRDLHRKQKQNSHNIKPRTRRSDATWKQLFISLKVLYTLLCISQIASSPKPNPNSLTSPAPTHQQLDLRTCAALPRHFKSSSARPPGQAPPQWSSCGPHRHLRPRSTNTASSRSALAANNGVKPHTTASPRSALAANTGVKLHTAYDTHTGKDESGTFAPTHRYIAPSNPNSPPHLNSTPKRLAVIQSTHTATTPYRNSHTVTPHRMTHNAPHTNPIHTKIID